MKTSKSCKWSSRFRFAQQGQAILEFALMLPCLLLLSVGIVEIGRALYYTIEVNNAAAAGVSYGAHQVSVGDFLITPMQTAAVADAANMSGTMTATATYGCTCDTGNGTSCSYPVPAPATCDTITCSGQIAHCVQVKTHATFSPIFNYPGLPTSFEANGKAVMRQP